MTDDNRAVVLASGGMDSATAAYEAQARGHDELYLLHTRYGQNTEQREYECARALAGHVDAADFCHVETSHLRQIGGSSLTDDEMDSYDALAAVLELVRAFEDRGPICELHEEAMPGLEGLGCDLCVRGRNPELRTERAVLDDVREAARVLATSPGVAAAIPNVGTNVGTALPGAETVSDVAAIPGRIYELGGRVEVPANPEFGASEHVATTILAATAVDPNRRGAVNLATDDELLDAATERELDAMEFDAGYEDRSERLREQFEARGAVPDVLFHRGAFGIEPITYVLGETGAKAAQTAAELIADAGER